jgi:hypothetical protein
MAEFWYRPPVSCMTLGTILSEQREMAVVVGMTSCAIEDCLVRRNVIMPRRAARGPSNELFSEGSSFAVRVVSVELTQSNLGERGVIHVRWPMVATLMF